MREEYQKTIILVSIMIIFGSLYGASFFDRGTLRQNNLILFSILTAATMIGFLQTKKIKQWKEEDETDYRLVYWSYMVLTSLLFLYLIYMIVTRSELECMRLLRINVSTGMYKVYYQGGNAIKNVKKISKGKLKNLRGGSSVDIGVENMGDSYGEGSLETGNVELTPKEAFFQNITVSGAFTKIFNGYKKIWKKILFIKD